MGNGSEMSLRGWDLRRASRCSGVSVTSSAVASTVDVPWGRGGEESCCLLSGVILFISSVVGCMIRMGDMDLIDSLELRSDEAVGSRCCCCCSSLLLFLFPLDEDDAESDE